MLKLLQWPFKGFMNFSITVVGFAGLGFWSYSIYSEGKFNQPIIGESIKLLGRNPQIKELVGMSVAMQASPSPTISQSATVLSKRKDSRISHSKSQVLAHPPTLK
jgi:hypothetical protein